MTLKMKRLTAAILATMAGTAYAEQQQKHHFDIPAQALGSALQTLAAQSGAPMLYAEQTAAGKQSPRLVGDYTTAEAADKLLAESGLVHSVAENGTVTVKSESQTTAGHNLKTDDSAWGRRGTMIPITKITKSAIPAQQPRPTRR